MKSHVIYNDPDAETKTWSSRTVCSSRSKKNKNKKNHVANERSLRMRICVYFLTERERDWARAARGRKAAASSRPRGSIFGFVFDDASRWSPSGVGIIFSKSHAFFSLSSTFIMDLSREACSCYTHRKRERARSGGERAREMINENAAGGKKYVRRNWQSALEPFEFAAFWRLFFWEGGEKNAAANRRNNAEDAGTKRVLHASFARGLASAYLAENRAWTNFHPPLANELSLSAACV